MSSARRLMQKKVNQMLLDGEIDAAILGAEIPTSRASRIS